MRALTLFERLIDSRDQFYRVFSGLAGTNVRTACKFAKKWLVSDRLPEGGHYAATPSTDQIKGLVGFALLFRCALGIERLVMDRKRRITVDELGTFLTDTVCRPIQALFLTNLLVALRGGDEGIRSLRAAVAHEVKAECPKLLPATPAYPPAFWPVARAVDDLVRAAGVASADRIPLSRLLRKKVEADCCIPDADVGADQAVLDRMRECLLAAVEAGASGGAGGDDDLVSAHRLSQAIGRKVRPSRWEGLDILFAAPNRVDADSAKISAFNVLSSDGATLLPIGLYALTTVGHGGQRGVPAEQLIVRLEKWGFEKAAIEAALTEMVEIDRRLIYSGVVDLFYGVRGWMDSNHAVRLSSAGREYLDTVIPSAAYIQWALSAIPAIWSRLSVAVASEETLGLARLDAAVAGLRLAEEDERRRLSTLFGDGLQAFQGDLSPFADMYFRGLHAFVLDVSRLQRGNFPEAARVAKEFVLLGRDMHRVRVERFQTVPPKWEEALAFSEDALLKRFRVVE